MKREIMSPGVRISASLLLCLLAAVEVTQSSPDLELEELVSQSSTCTPTARSESVCQSTNQTTYRQFNNSFTQDSLEEFLSDADLFLSGLSAGETEGCRQVITDLLCNIIFTPCSNNTAREPFSVCPAYCTCLSGSCAGVYRKLQDRRESDIIANMILNLTESCIPMAMNSSATLLLDDSSDMQCVNCPATMISNPATLGITQSELYTIIGACGGALLLVVVVVTILEGLCCYYCCKPTKMNMSMMMDDYELDLAREFRIKDAREFDYSMAHRSRTMSRAAMLKMVLFSRVTKVRKTRFQPVNATHSKLPEPYKTVLKDHKHLVIQHRKISLDKMISKGVVGELYRGTMLEPSGGHAIIPVTMAVRVIDDVLHEGICINMVQDICKVADLLHPHLLNPVGVAIEVEKPLYIVYPFMENRDIKTYLRKLQGDTTIKTIPRISLIFQVALGMEFLASRGIVHRNLCAKHCVLDSSLTVKICGFGAPENYAMATTYSLPAEEVDNWKWMPLELLEYIDSLEAEHFSECTDVWSFGVTAWEIFTLEEPYEGKYLSDIIPQLTKGKRLNKPPNCADAIYQLLLWCWLSDTTRRPTMQEVSSTVHKYLSDGWEAEFGAGNSISGPSSTEGSGASVHSAGEVRNEAHCKKSKNSHTAPSPPTLQSVEVVGKTADKGWAEKEEGRRVGEGGEEDDADAYMNVCSRRMKEEEEEFENDLARSSTWVDGEPDEEYVISLDRFLGQNSGNSLAMLLPGNHQASSVGPSVESELTEDEREASHPIYSNCSAMSLHTLNSTSNHNNTFESTPPTVKSHAHGHSLRPSRSTEDGLSSSLQQGAAPKTSSSLHTLQ